MTTINFLLTIINNIWDDWYNRQHYTSSSYSSSTLRSSCKSGLWYSKKDIEYQLIISTIEKVK